MRPCLGTVFDDQPVERPHIRRLRGVAIPLRNLVNTPFSTDELVEGLCLFVGIDRTSKFAVTQLVDKADRRTAWEFLEHLLKAVPYRIHTILTDNGIQFAE